MAQIIPEQWLSMESNGFEQLFGITSRCSNAFERLTALNLQAFRFGLAETQEALARTCVANNLPDVLCLPTLLAPVGFAQALSYSRQIFEIMSARQLGSAPQQPIGAARQPHLADNLPGGLATQSLVPSDVRTKPAMSSASSVPTAATAAVEREKRRPDKQARSSGGRRASTLQG